MYILQTTPENH